MLRKLYHLKTEQLSTRVLYVLVALTVVIFALFFTVGYDRPYAEDPQFNAPQLTDVVLWFMYALVFVACFVAVCSLIHAFKQRGKGEQVVNNLPAAKIKYFAFGLTLVLMILTFLLGSTEPVVVNGSKFADSLWLKLTDMFLNTSLLLLVVAAVGVAFGLSGRSRNIVLKGHNTKKKE